MRFKNIEAEYIQEAINEINDEEYDRILYEEVKKKDNAIKTSVKSERKNKISNYLLQKGFEYGKVFEIVEYRLNEGNEE